MNRRQVLALGSCVGSSSIAGCLDLFEEEYAIINRILLSYLKSYQNEDLDPVTLEIQIEREDTDEVVYQGSYELNEDEATNVDCVWPTDPVTIRVRPTHSDEWTSTSATDYSKCVVLHFEWSGVSEEIAYASRMDDCPITLRGTNCHLDVGDEDQS